MIYISGGISNDPNYKKKFKKAERVLRSRFPSTDIFNPADVSLPDCCGWEDYEEIYLKFLIRSNTIFLLDDWYKSKNALIEHQYAKVKNLTIIFERDINEEESL